MATTRALAGFVVAAAAETLRIRAALPPHVHDRVPARSVDA